MEEPSLNTSPQMANSPISPGAANGGSPGPRDVAPAEPEEHASLQTMADDDVSLKTVIEGSLSAQAPSTGTRGSPDRFRILRPHAKGGLGQVSVALDQELNREVALKEILVHFSEDTAARERFVLEAEITGGLEHPGIVPVYALGQREDGQPFYAMRFIKGDSLKQAIEEFHKSDSQNPVDPGERQLALRQLLDRFIAVCNAMEYAHSRGVLHRDLKPGNIMVGKFGETLVVDWGLAKAVGQKEVGGDAPLRPSVLSGSVQTMQGSAIGTPAYMSPEQSVGKLDELGPTTDVYSLGATLYHLLCGRPPFERESLPEILRKVRLGEFPRPRDVLPAIPRGLEAICLKGMALRPEDRYQRAVDMADDIQHWLADEPISAATDTPSERLSRWARKHKGWVQAGSVSLLLVTIISSIAYGVVSVANGRLNSANQTISNQNSEITGKNEELLNTNTQLAAARTDAELKRDEAIEQRAKARELVREASRSDFATAQARLADGKWREAMAYLGRALRYDPENASAREALWMTMRYGQRDAPCLPRHSLRHQDAVLSAAFSPDGKRVVTASRDHTAQIWDVETGHPIGPPLKHQGYVNSACFSPDGTQVVTASSDTIAQFWDALTGKEIGPGMQHPEAINFAKFSPDGDRIVTASADKTAQIWDAKTSSPIGSPLVHQDAVNFACFSPDGLRVVTASSDRTARVWDANSGELVGTPLEHQAAVNRAAFNPDGTAVVTASSDNTARIWDVGTGQPISPPLSHSYAVNTAEFSPDGTRVVTASDDKTARIWDSQTGLPVGRPLSHEGEVASAVFSADGTRIITATKDQDIKASKDQAAQIWDAQTGRTIGRPLSHESSVLSATFCPDGDAVITASEDATARIWNAHSGQPIGHVLKHDGPVKDAVFSTDGARVVTTSDDATARIWDQQTGLPAAQPLKHQRSVNSARFSMDGTRIVTASDDSTARVWNAKTGESIGQPLTHDGVVVSASFSHDGRNVLTTSEDKTARIWNVEASRMIGKPLKHDDFVTCARFSPNGKQIVTASRDKSARIWNSATAEPMGTPLLHEDAAYYAGFSPDGTRIISASRLKTPRIWNAQTGQPIEDQIQQPDSVYLTNSSRDGGRILTVNSDNSVRIWDSMTAQQMGPALNHEHRISSASFSADGTQIITTSEDKTARIWDTATGQPIGPALVHASPLINASFSPDNTQIVMAPEDGKARIWDVRSVEELDGNLAESLATFAAGARLDRRIGILEHESIELRLQRVSELHQGLAATPEWLLLFQLELAQQPENPISPHSTVARREEITRLIQLRSSEDVRTALELDPSHPLIQIALAGLKGYSKQADFLRAYGVTRLPKDATFCREAAEMLLRQKDHQRATQAINQAAELEPDHPETIRIRQFCEKAATANGQDD